MEQERDKKHNDIASWLDNNMENEPEKIKETAEEPVVEVKPKKKKKQKTRKGKSRYEKYRAKDGKIDYNLAYSREKGGPIYNTLSKDDKKRIAFEKGTTLFYLQCPVCYAVRHLIVKVDHDGKPMKSHEDGIEFKMVDGVLQRRFSGPQEDYLPLMAKINYGRYGQYAKVDESMAISTLKRLDKSLFDDFKKMLEKSLFKFQ